MSALARWHEQSVIADVLGLDTSTIVADSLRADPYTGRAWWLENDGAYAIRRSRDLSRDEVNALLKAVQQ